MNIVDSCGWLEHFLAGPNADFFAPVLQDADHLMVSALSVFEVCRRVVTLYGADQAEVVHRAMASLPVVQLDAAGMHLAALNSVKHKLHMADAIIWQTAQAHGALLYTQDAALSSLPGVVYQAKPLFAAATTP